MISRTRTVVLVRQQDRLGSKPSHITLPDPRHENLQSWTKESLESLDPN